MSDVKSSSLFAAVAPAADGDEAQRDAEVRALIADGADPSASDAEGGVPTHPTVALPRNGDAPLPSPQVVEALLEAGADVHAVDAHGSTPAAWAADAQDSDPQAVVDRSLAVRCARPRAVELLLTRGADARTINHLGRTPRESRRLCRSSARRGGTHERRS
ncbi:hypothetical protein AB0E67_28450 [Streptomyces sp. NPDC032161]|uniref:ankyrin repeat domain-containing protein n=1 Tax=unclassified Streptomyces TaxID=2593676 RepID=UPI00340909F8